MPQRKQPVEFDPDQQEFEDFEEYEESPSPPSRRAPPQLADDIYPVPGGGDEDRQAHQVAVIVYACIEAVIIACHIGAIYVLQQFGKITFPASSILNAVMGDRKS